MTGKRKAIFVKAGIGGDGDRWRVVTLTERRVLQVLRLLMERGERGLTAADMPAGTRLSSYVHKLRTADVDILTDEERNADGIGTHGRYRLGCRVRILDHSDDWQGPLVYWPPFPASKAAS